MSRQWKYLVVELKTGLMGGFKLEALQEELDKHGRAGWELVNVVQPCRRFLADTRIQKEQ